MKNLIEVTNASLEERYKLAQTTADIDVLNSLAKDNSWLVRRSVAANPKSTPAILEELAKDDEDWSIRCAVAINPNATLAILEELAKDEDVDIREAALKRLREKEIN